MRISSRRVDRAQVFSLSGPLRTDVDQTLMATRPLAELVVLDLQDVDVLTVRSARALITFASACANGGIDCVLLPNPANTAGAVVLNSADPGRSVPRFATLDQAMAAGSRARTHDVLSASAVNTLAFDSTDLGRTEEFMSQLYAPMRITSATGKSGAHITRVATDTVSTDKLDFAFEMTYDVRPLGKICLCDIDSGTIQDHRVAGWRAPEAFGPGDLFSFAPPDRAYRGRICEARYSITMFAPALLDQVAGTERPVRLLDHHPISRTAARHVRTAITHLRDDVLSVPDVGENPLIVSAASRYLAASVLNAFQNTALSGRTDADRRDAHPQSLRRAIAFIEGNADRNISATDIARAAHVSARAVQLAFRRHLGMTPTAYLRRVRLDCARAELRSAAPGDTTVTQVAARWGYARHSVFAAHYHTAFGESPSRTLHRD